MLDFTVALLWFGTKGVFINNKIYTVHLKMWYVKR